MIQVFDEILGYSTVTSTDNDFLTKNKNLKVN